MAAPRPWNITVMLHPGVRHTYMCVYISYIKIIHIMKKIFVYLLIYFRMALWQSTERVGHYWAQGK